MIIADQSRSADGRTDRCMSAADSAASSCRRLGEAGDAPRVQEVNRYERSSSSEPQPMTSGVG